METRSQGSDTKIVQLQLMPDRVKKLIFFYLLTDTRRSYAADSLPRHSTRSPAAGLPLALTCGSFLDIFSSQLISDDMWKGATDYDAIPLLCLAASYVGQLSEVGCISKMWYGIAGKNLRELDLETPCIQQQTNKLMIMDMIVKNGAKLQKLVIPVLRSTPSSSRQETAIRKILCNSQSSLKHLRIGVTQIRVIRILRNVCLPNVITLEISSVECGSTERYLKGCLEILENFLKCGAKITTFVLEWIGLYHAVLPNMTNLIPHVKNFSLMVSKEEEVDFDIWCTHERFQLKFTGDVVLKVGMANGIRLISWALRGGAFKGIKELYLTLKNGLRKGDIESGFFHRAGSLLQGLTVKRVAVKRDDKLIRSLQHFCPHLRELEMEIEVAAVQMFSEYVISAEHLENVCLKICMIADDAPYTVRLQISANIIEAFLKSKSILRSLRYWCNPLEVHYAVCLLEKYGGKLRRLELQCISRKAIFEDANGSISVEDGIRIYQTVRRYCSKLEVLHIGTFHRIDLSIETFGFNSNRSLPRARRTPVSIVNEMDYTMRMMPNLEDQSIYLA